MPKPEIRLIDTSVFLNLLDIPGRNQDRLRIIGEVKAFVEAAGNLLFLPYATVVETGNFIAQISNANQRRIHAEKFLIELRKALDNETPWQLIDPPSRKDLLRWAGDSNFMDLAERGIGWSDFSIIQEWETQCTRFRSYQVSIWSLDGDLQGYVGNSSQ